MLHLHREKVIIVVRCVMTYSISTKKKLIRERERKEKSSTIKTKLINLIPDAYP